MLDYAGSTQLKDQIILLVARENTSNSVVKSLLETLRAPQINQQQTVYDNSALNFSFLPRCIFFTEEGTEQMAKSNQSQV